MASELRASSTESVTWNHSRQEQSPPIIQDVPYAEMKLEHDHLEEARMGSRFFPAAIPYRLGREHRVFFWRPFLPDSHPNLSSWDGVCATTHELLPIDNQAGVRPRLWTQQHGIHELVVDGTVAGDLSTVALRDYQPPNVSIKSITASQIELDAGGTAIHVQRGSQQSVALPTQSVCPHSTENDVTDVEPRLDVRYPGERTIYHPNSDTNYAVFPSFDLDIRDIPNPVHVPVVNGELDHVTLASRIGVDLSKRPYPERVLWEAFAYQAFDPNRDGVPRLAQCPSGLILLENPRF